MVLWLPSSLRRAVRCIYTQLLQVNPPNPAVCHGTLRVTLRGGHGHVLRPYIDPISLYLVTLTSQGGFPQVPGNKKYKEEVNITEKLQELKTKLYPNEYIDERQTLANTHGLPARELPVCNTNSDEPLRFVWHQLKDMYIYESSHMNGNEQKYWNEDTDSNPNTSSVGPSDSPQLYWRADRNRKKVIINITLVKHHCTNRPTASRTARFTSKMQTDCRYIIYELELLYE